MEYVLVSAEEIEIEVFRKNDRGKWEVTNYIAGDVVELESINLTFPIDQVYRGIEFWNQYLETLQKCLLLPNGLSRFLSYIPLFRSPKK